MVSFLRTNILRGGRGSGGGGEEGSEAAQSPSPQEVRQPRRPEMEQRQEAGEGRSRGSFPFSRRFLPALFTGRANNDAAGRGEPAGHDGRFDEDEGPKTPRLDHPHHRPHHQGVPPPPSSHVSRAWTRGSSRPSNDTEAAPPPPPSSSNRASSPSSRRSSASVANPTQYPGLATPPAVAALRFGDNRRNDNISSSRTSLARPPSVVSERRRFEGPDPAELHLAELAESGRRRRRLGGRRGRSGERRHHGNGGGGGDSRPGSSGSRGSSSSSGSEQSRRFLFCFPWVNSPRLRGQILKCFVSGLFMVTMLSVCAYIPTYLPVYPAQVERHPRSSEPTN